jgi:protein involved in polysaccharide export with SLBB domain
MMTRLACACLLLVVHASSGFAQAPGVQSAQGFLITRAELTELLSRYEAAAAAPTYSSAVRQQAGREADLIRARLEHGDLRVGDQVVLFVQNDATLSATFVVTNDRTLLLPEIGAVPLGGVLRSELVDHLRAQIGRYIRDPYVTATSKMRITVLGEVGRPGFEVVSSDALITEVMTAMGGPTRRAALDKIRVERGGQVIWEGEALQNALVTGRTLDQLSLQAGDQIVVPASRSRGDAARWALSTIPPLILLLTRIF